MSRRLARVESRNVTYVSEGWPVFWREARGANVRDADGNVYVDLTGAFGVALLGHGCEVVAEAVARQAEQLVHGMGDVHPPTAKLELLERLATIAPWSEYGVVLATSGSEAVEAGLKTACLASGHAGILAFEGAYHGLTLGSLATTHREHFRAPFSERLYGGVAFSPFPDPVRDGEGAGEAALRSVAEHLRVGAPNGDRIGAVIVEPVQARGGARIPPDGFMAKLSDLAAQHGALVVADEIMTGLGRCGGVLASDLVGLRPDIVCIGKVLGGGLPLSACIARREVMDAWPASRGEAVHTSTFLGHPLACAAASAVLGELGRGEVVAKARALGSELVDGLSARLEGIDGVLEVRGLGLLVGIELVEPDGATPAAGAATRVAERALSSGILVLPAGGCGHVVELTPPATLSRAQLEFVVETLAEVVAEVAAGRDR